MTRKILPPLFIFDLTEDTYDALGRLIRQEEPNAVKTYTYDSFNRMTSAGATAFTYRSDGLRHSVTTNYITTTHIWDGAN